MTVFVEEPLAKPVGLLKSLSKKAFILSQKVICRVMVLAQGGSVTNVATPSSLYANIYLPANRFTIPVTVLAKQEFCFETW